MVIDTSALIAVLTDEPDAERYGYAMDRDSTRLMSVASALETVMVLEARFGDGASQELDLLVHRLPIRLIAVDTDQFEWARVAFRRFGRGRHPAALNFGDCFSYALAKVTGEALLYKGNDFGQTDLRNALEQP
jgi:ribonuclease VapC